MMLSAIYCVQYFCIFAEMLFIVNLLIKTDSTVICVPCMLEHVCYEPFSFKNCRFGRYLTLINWLNFVYCLKFTRLRSDLNK